MPSRCAASKPAGQLKSQSDDRLFRQRSARQSLVEPAAGDVFGHQVIDRLGVEIVGGSDVGMVQLANSAGFTAKTFAGAGVSQGFGGKDLQGHMAVKTLIAGEPHLSLAAAAYLFG